MHQNVMTKLLIALGGAGSSIFLMGQAAEGGSKEMDYIHYGAMGVLAVCVVYMVIKIVPDAMVERAKETQAFISTLTEERQKLVASMEALTTLHANEIANARKDSERMIREMHLDSIEERKEWAKLMREGIEIQAKTHAALDNMSYFLRTNNATLEIKA